MWTNLPPLTAEDIERYRREQLSECEHDIRPYLENDEVLLAVVPASISYSVNEPPLRYLPKDSMPWQIYERFVRFADAVDFEDRLVDASCGIVEFRRGVPKGGWKGQAGQFVIAAFTAAKLARAPERELSLVVSNRRVRMFTPPRSSRRRPRPMQLVVEYPVSGVGFKVLDRYSTHWDVVMEFQDGSCAPLSVGSILGRAAGPVLGQLLGEPAQ